MGENVPLDVSLLREGTCSALGLARKDGLPHTSRHPLPFVVPPARRALSGKKRAIHKPDPTKIPSPCSHPRLSAGRSQNRLTTMPGRSHGDPFGRKPCPQRRTQEQERVLIFVGSGFALRAAAHLSRQRRDAFAPDFALYMCAVALARSVMLVSLTSPSTERGMLRASLQVVIT